MPIQFRCKHCQSWIEVDGEHAGGKAACPYCQTVNSVPRQSESPAEPMSQGPYTGVPTEATRPGAPEVPVSKPLESRQADQRFEHEPGRFDAGREGLPRPPATTQRFARMGVLGLAGAILSVVLVVIMVALAFRYLPPATQQQFLQADQMSPEQQQDFQKQIMTELSAVLQERPWLVWIVYLGLLLWAVSLAINIRVIFARGMHRRTYAWAGLAVNTLVLFVCICSSIMQRLPGS